MGSPPGPLPKRDSERRRQNKPDVPTDAVSMPGSVKPLPCPTGLHALARGWYKSLAASGQSKFYEPSDWATARVWATLLSAQLNSKRGPSSMMIAAWQQAATELLTTEGARRRMRMEIHRGNVAEVPVSDMEAYRRAKGG